MPYRRGERGSGEPLCRIAWLRFQFFRVSVDPLVRNLFALGINRIFGFPEASDPVLPASPAGGAAPPPHWRSRSPPTASECNVSRSFFPAKSVLINASPRLLPRASTPQKFLPPAGSLPARCRRYFPDRSALRTPTAGSFAMVVRALHIESAPARWF